ncbi:unnamed protein product [Pleuronectes platessa]|uniref:Uncharacterized protein n=1 Tax=Pleuronectes platessa TaxID=8262 RepID=A0A9N7VUF4_PLEPL|nr:unnamed protein product [Pleuronectes platessa]
MKCVERKKALSPSGCVSWGNMLARSTVEMKEDKKADRVADEFVKGGGSTTCFEVFALSFRSLAHRASFDTSGPYAPCPSHHPLAQLSVVVHLHITPVDSGEGGLPETSEAARHSAPIPRDGRLRGKRLLISRSQWHVKAVQVTDAPAECV